MMFEFFAKKEVWNNVSAIFFRIESKFGAQILLSANTIIGYEANGRNLETLRNYSPYFSETP